jgi:hypothetical protein
VIATTSFGERSRHHGPIKGVNRMNVVERFGGGVHTFPFSVRLGVSVPLVLWNAWLLFELIMWSLDGDPRPAALMLIILAPSAFMTGAFMKGLWRSRHEWLAERRDEDRSDFAREQRLAWSAPEREFPIGTYDGVSRDAPEVAQAWTQPPDNALEPQRNLLISLTALAIPLKSDAMPAPFAYREPDESRSDSPTDL